MALYKYVTADRKDILRNGLVRFTQPAALNDPWEMKPYIDSLMTDELWEGEIRSKAEEAYNSEDAIKKAAQDYWGKLNRKQRRTLPLSQVESKLKKLVKEHPEEMQRLYLTYFNAAVDMAVARQKELVSMIPDIINKTLGILSLSENPTHRLMWSHYAATFSGFVISFDESHSFLTARHSDEDEIGGLHKVTYSPELPKMQAFIDFSDEHLSSISTKFFFH